jgi:crossover junction endodeoxyribonuclease RuvC
MAVLVFLGVDPGKSGSIACVAVDGAVLSVIRNTETLHDQYHWLIDGTQVKIAWAAIEKVGSMPGQGVSSTFKFGRSFGQLEGLLVGAGIPFEFVRPQAWQKDMGCRSKGDKNITKAAAQRLWPKRRIVHAEADALLLAEWARRRWHQTHSAQTELPEVVSG